MSRLATIVAELSGVDPIAVGSGTLAGTELALTVAINPEQPYAEAARTPQLVSELGQLAAFAHAAKERAELAYRIWRDTQVWRLTNDVTAAMAAGFECACDPGVDAKGIAKPARTPSVAAVEVYLRTLPEYQAMHEVQIEAGRAWSALHTSYEGAKARQWAIRMKEDLGGDAGADGPQLTAGLPWQPPAPTAGAGGVLPSATMPVATMPVAAMPVATMPAPPPLPGFPPPAPPHIPATAGMTGDARRGPPPPPPVQE